MPRFVVTIVKRIERIARVAVDAPGRAQVEEEIRAYHAAGAIEFDEEHDRGTEIVSILPAQEEINSL